MSLMGGSISASLHAREVIKKLMLFSRQSPQQKSLINLNSIVQEGLYFLESRCAKASINLVKELNRHLPDFVGDKSQLYQILVNLVLCQPHNVGYNLFSLILASSLVKRQFTFASISFRCVYQAAIS